jgi:tRNA 2-thiouridine synthesizing protein A
LRIVTQRRRPGKPLFPHWQVSGIPAQFRKDSRKKMNIDAELDTSGLNCPLPIIKAKKALAGLASGQLLRVIATDPGSVQDFEIFCRQTKNDLLDSREKDGKFHFLMKKA